MDSDNLVNMANRIGDFFDAFPDRAQALTGVADHVGRFWEPRMRRQILALLDGPAGDALRPLVAEALRANRDRLAPRQA